RTDQDRIEGAEHRGETADAERQRSNRDSREPGIAAQVPPGIMDILPERFEPVCSTDVTAIVLDLFGAPELHAHSATGVFLTHARAHQIGNSFLDVKAHLAIEIDFLLVTSKPTPPIHCWPPSAMRRIKPTAFDSRCQLSDSTSRCFRPLSVSR